MKPRRRSNRIILALLLTLWVTPGFAHAQARESDLRVYGYLQASFYYEMGDDSPPDDYNSFTVQQLDIMLQKDLARHWSAFVDLLLTNNYSSFRNVGAFDLQQAWVKYRRNYFLSVKLGLLIPRFNYLNEIKNKMPVLPYIIRPIVYETSFQEDVFLDEFVPHNAFVEVNGYAPVNDYKLDYAVYVGNSPNISTGGVGFSGLDTTATFLIGGRVGVRHPLFEVGFSATRDEINYLSGVDDRVTPPLQFPDTRRVRLGSDFSLELENLTFRTEYIRVLYDEDHPTIDVDKTFFYGTVGYRFISPLFVYVSYWWLEQGLAERTPPNNLRTADWRMKIPNAGVSYQLNDRVTFKAHAARAIQTWSVSGLPERSFSFYAAAVSVMF